MSINSNQMMTSRLPLATARNMRFFTSLDAHSFLKDAPLVLFLGNGPKLQYADVESVMEALDLPLRNLSLELGN